jgi:hypothetical protein
MMPLRDLLEGDDLSKVSSMIRSPGWEVLVERWLLPLYAQITEQMARPGVDAVRTEFYRGNRAFARLLMDELHGVAGKPNPFDVPAQYPLPVQTAVSEEVETDENGANSRFARGGHTGIPVE